MNEQNTTTEAPKTEAQKTPVNTAAPVPTQINWRQAAANTGVTLGALGLLAGGIYAYRKFKK